MSLPGDCLFVSLPETSVTVADYLFPGEGVEDCLANIKEIFGVEVEEDQIEDDLEIVASPRDSRPVAGQLSVTNLERFSGDLWCHEDNF